MFALFDIYVCCVKDVSGVIFLFILYSLSDLLASAVQDAIDTVFS